MCGLVPNPNCEDDDAANIDDDNLEITQ